jgi:hypothetical protein
LSTLIIALVLATSPFGDGDDLEDTRASVNVPESADFYRVLARDLATHFPRTPRKPDGGPGTGRGALVTSAAKAMPMAPTALWPERIQSLRHIARTCLPSKRGHEVLLTWLVHAARR